MKWQVALTDRNALQLAAVPAHSFQCSGRALPMFWPASQPFGEYGAPPARPKMTRIPALFDSLRFKE